MISVGLGITSIGWQRRVTNLLSNGDFANGLTGWTAGAGWEAIDGHAVMSDVTNNDIEQSVEVTAGIAYLCEITTSNRTNGNVRMRFEGATVVVAQSSFNQNGVYSAIIVAPAGADVRFSVDANSGWNGRFTSAIVRRT